MEFKFPSQKAWALFCVFLLSGFLGGAVNANDKTYYSLADQERLLSDVLEELSQQYKVFFNYESALIQGVKVDFHFKKGESIVKSVDRLLAKTNLSFEVTGERFIIIYKDDKRGKKKARKIKRKIKQIRKLERSGEVVLQRNNKNPTTQSLNIIEAVLAKQVEKKGRDLPGIVQDVEGQPLIGVTVQVQGAEGQSKGGVITDVDGGFVVNVEKGYQLTFSYIGMETQTIEIQDQERLVLTMIELAEQLEGVTVVAYGQQKKESVIASVTSVRPEELRVPSSNLTTALAGRMSGIISYQRSGEPGQDNAQFFIRGATTFGFNTSPLILIDGIELTATDLSRLHPDDISSFSVMKDATATALYGARGANGVILVTTKEGKEGKATVNIRIENSISAPTQEIELAGPITYMQLHNEAVRTRDPLGFLPYSKTKIANTIAGKNADAYPQTDWASELLKDQTINQRINFNVSGGGKIARYYLAGGYVRDNGVLNVDQRSDFNSNIKLGRSLIRSNININLTESTEVIVRMHGTFDDYRGPINGGAAMYRAIVRANPALFPAFYTPDEANKQTKHILFGNAGAGNYINPYAELVKGYKEYSESLLLAQFEIKQDLSFIAEGLKFRVLTNTTRKSFFDVTRAYEPFYYSLGEFDEREDIYRLDVLNANTGETTLDYRAGSKLVSSTFYTESALEYNRSINERHNFSGLLVGILRQFLDGNTSSLQASLPKRNIGISGRFTYAFDSRYFLEYNFGYNGSERFSRNERFGFFPSGGVGWYISNEKFWAPLSKTVNKLKLKFTYGLVGNDAIGANNDRFFYLSNVNLNSDDRSYRWGTDASYFVNGVDITRYANDKITWEKAAKFNFGIELGLWQNLDLQVDLFREDRTNILMDRVAFATFGLQSPTKANLGEASSQGIDLSLDYQLNRPGFWLLFRGSFTYARGVFEKVEEPDYSNTPWLSRVGQPLSQSWGYIAERFFIDDAEVANSPVQEIGGIVRGGDIKYRDVNGDGKINGLDRVPIGFPTVPEIVYGFGTSFGFKNIDVSVFLQGSARSSFWIDARATAPFVNYHYQNDPFANSFANNALLKAFAESHWSEDNPNVYALWPRLADHEIPNNTTTNTWFMQNGLFLRVKSVEIGYSLAGRFLQDRGIRDARIYLSGTNLFHFSKFKLWDPEMGGNGLGYPLQRVINIGAHLSF